MPPDILQLVKDALTHMGVPLSVMNKLDANAPIVFSFNNGIVMNLIAVDDAIWLVSPLADYSDKLITQNGAKLLEQILRHSPFFVTGKMQLSHEEGKLVLRGLVSPESLEKPAYFAATLQVFFDMAGRLRGIIKE